MRLLSKLLESLVRQLLGVLEMLMVLPLLPMPQLGMLWLVPQLNIFWAVLLLVLQLGMLLLVLQRPHQLLLVRPPPPSPLRPSPPALRPSLTPPARSEPTNVRRSCRTPSPLSSPRLGRHSLGWTTPERDTSCSTPCRLPAENALVGQTSQTIGNGSKVSLTTLAGHKAAGGASVLMRECQRVLPPTRALSVEHLPLLVHRTRKLLVDLHVQRQIIGKLSRSAVCCRILSAAGAVCCRTAFREHAVLEDTPETCPPPPPPAPEAASTAHPHLPSPAVSREGDAEPTPPSSCPPPPHPTSPPPSRPSGGPFC